MGGRQPGRERLLRETNRVWSEEVIVWRSLS